MNKLKFSKFLSATLLVLSFLFCNIASSADADSSAHKRAPERFDLLIWGGLGVDYQTGGNMLNFRQQPMLAYQLGVAKSIAHFSPHFLYLAFIFDTAYSKKDLLAGFDAWYYAFNEQLVLGYEYFFLHELSLFVEAGAVYQQRAFTIGTSRQTAIDYAFVNPWGFTSNVGMNFTFAESKHASYLIRVAMNVMVGTKENHTLNYNHTTVNVNPVFIGPFFSFGVRL